MTTNQPIMGFMQPFSIAGAIAPTAQTHLPSTGSKNDPTGFAALLGGTALTMPLVQTGESGALRPPLPQTPFGQAVPDMPGPQGPASAQPPLAGSASAASLPLTASADAMLSAPALAPEVAPANNMAGTEMANGLATDVAPPTVAVQAKPRLAEAEEQPLPQSAPAPEALVGMTDRPRIDATVARPEKAVEPASSEDEDAPIALAAPQDQPMPAAVPQPLVAPAPVPTVATGQAKRSPSDVQSQLAPATGAPPVPGARDSAALASDGQAQMTGDDTKQDFDADAPPEPALSQRSDPTAPQSRETASAPKDFASALDASAARPAPEAPRGIDAKPSVQSQPQAQPTPAAEPVVRASAPGHDMGIALSRHAGRDGEQVVTLRLDPGELGRIEVRLAVDEEGRMTARISADHRQTLELIRRDTDTLVRTLNDAGVRADAQGFRFDGGGSQTGQNAAWGGQQGQHGQGRHVPFQPDLARSGSDLPDALAASAAQPMGTAAGRVDLLA